VPLDVEALLLGDVGEAQRLAHPRLVEFREQGGCLASLHRVECADLGGADDHRGPDRYQPLLLGVPGSEESAGAFGRSTA
jgi:hypothetical protein